MVQGGHSTSLLPSCSAPECRLIVPGSTKPHRAPLASGHVWQQEEKLIEVSSVFIFSLSHLLHPSQAKVEEKIQEVFSSYKLNHLVPR